MPISGIEFRKASTQEWVDAFARDPADEDGLRLRGAGHDGTGYLTVLYADIPGNSWNANRLAKFAERAQQLLDFRQPLTSLPDDDPDKFTDPAQPNLFWDGGDLVSRSVVISNVTYSVEEGLNFTLTRTV